MMGFGLLTKFIGLFDTQCNTLQCTVTRTRARLQSHVFTAVPW
jgi:hypothetical protein